MTDVHERGAPYDRFGRSAYGLVLAMLDCEQSAEDAVAEGFTRFLAHGLVRCGSG